MKFFALTLLFSAFFFLSAEQSVTLSSLMNDGVYWPTSTRFLVIVHQYDGDIGWASRLNFPHIIYEKNKPEKEPFNAINKAKAESNLVKFIAEFYDDLPENIIQVYQYEYKPCHEGSLVDILNAPDFELKYENSKTKGFWNFNRVNMGNVAAQIPRMLESGWWPETMSHWFGDIRDYGNFTEGKRACAQFVVSRERIRTLPREFYVNMYTWLVTKTIGEVNTSYHPIKKYRLSTPLDNHSNSNYYTSRYMEWSWELIFTSHKTNENIDVSFATNEGVGSFHALYGAKKYYRDVTKEIASRFLDNKKIAIPTTANFNKLFTDVIYGTPKSLIITVNGKEYKIPEFRANNIVINLNATD